MFDDVEFIYSENKDAVLRQTRGIGFDEIIYVMQGSGVVDVIDQPDQIRYAGEKLAVVKVRDYIWFVPFIKFKNKVTLKTAYPTRKANKIYTQKVH